MDAKQLSSGAAGQFLRHTDGVIYSTVMDSGVSINTDQLRKPLAFCTVGEGVDTSEAFVQMRLRDRKVERISIWVGLATP